MVVALVVLAVAAFTAQTLSLGAWRHQPRYDEVSYIQVARDYHRMGGVIEVVRCHLDGLCREDNRFPTFVLLLQAFAHDGPAFFADAKLITLATALLLLAAVGLLAWRSFGPSAGVVSVLLLALNPTLGEIGSGVLADVLYAVTLVVAVRAIALALDRGAAWWLAAGALVGLAYLTKGNGHLALLALFTAAVTLHGPRVFATLRPYAALLGFAAVAGFLLWRNVIDYDGNPFHNFNDRFALARQLAGDSAAGPVARLAPHRARLLLASPLGVRARLAHHQGLGQTLGALCYTAGLGITAGRRPSSPPASPAPSSGSRPAPRSSRSRGAACTIAVAAAIAARSWPSGTLPGG